MSRCGRQARNHIEIYNYVHCVKKLQHWNEIFFSLWPSTNTDSCAKFDLQFVTVYFKSKRTPPPIITVLYWFSGLACIGAVPESERPVPGGSGQGDPWGGALSVPPLLCPQTERCQTELSEGEGGGLLLQLYRQGQWVSRSVSYKDMVIGSIGQSASKASLVGQQPT